jgi:Cysteine-rich CPXCG
MTRHALVAGPADLETWDTEVEVACPYCGEVVTIGVDPAGGAVQTYVEDSKCVVGRGTYTSGTMTTVAPACGSRPPRTALEIPNHVSLKSFL